MILTQGEGNRGHAFGQGDVGQVNDLADFHLEHIDFDVLGDLRWKTLDFDVRFLVLDDTALGLHAVGLLFVDEVDWYVDLDGLVLIDAQKVRVHDAFPGRVALQVLENGLLLVLADIDRQNVGVESLIFQRLFQILANQRQGLWVLVATVDNGWDMVGETTQAAARTFPQVLSYFCV